MKLLANISDWKIPIVCVLLLFLPGSLGIKFPDQQNIWFKSQAYQDMNLACDEVIYQGVVHCGNPNDVANVVIIDPNDPVVHFQTVLSSNSRGEECNSVNHWGKDSSSNCPNPYPFELVENMLERYRQNGGVAVINTDYFGFPDGDHGAQGLAVRNGERLDGPKHGVTTTWALRAPALGISPDNQIVILVPESQEFIDQHLKDQLFNSIGGGPMLVEDGKLISHPCKAFVGGDTCSRVGQSAIGITRDNRLVLITAKLDANDLAQFLIERYQVWQAIKLDGGGSSSLAWIDHNGAIKVFRGRNETRPVAEGLLVFSQAVPERSSPEAKMPTPSPISSQQADKQVKYGKPIDGFGIGTSAHLRLGINNVSDAYQQQHNLGLRWTREEFPWSEMESDGPGIFTSKIGNRDFDKMVEEATRYDIKILALLTYGPNPKFPYHGQEELLSR